MSPFKSNIPELRGFYELQPHHVQEILLVSSLYDAFIFEEDGQLTERIFSEYIDFHLHYAPRVTQVESAEKALKMLAAKNYDMVITTLQLEDVDAVEFCANIKKEYPHTSTVLLTHAPSKLSNIPKAKLNKSFDGIFSWNGDTKIFLAIIKLIEDKLNAKHDTEVANVRVILVVEDSIKNYSSFLPPLYYEIMAQTKELISESLNKDQRIFRMRTRPKILLATNYEEAVTIYEEFKDYLIGIISDVRFPKEGKQDPEAGFEFLKKVKNAVPDLPIILHSSEPSHRWRANMEGAAFLDKNSPTMLQELRDFFRTNLGFGDFIFRVPSGDVVDQAKDMLDLEQKLKTVPEESLKYHAQRNHFSIWLMARGEFILANELRPRTLDDYKNMEELRQDLIRSLSASRYKSQQGVIAEFACDRFDPHCNFTRIGSGSLGGKARGIAFISALLAQRYTTQLKKKYSNITIKVPTTFVIGTDEFDKFMKINNLSKIALEEKDDHVIAERFIEAGVSKELHDNLRMMLKSVDYPLAVRSSSLLEDSHAQPFAGIYATYM
ncbi:MAG: PEP/pyruvate-binding domain-containing protein, partial [bacterium]